MGAFTPTKTAVTHIFDSLQSGQWFFPKDLKHPNDILESFVFWRESQNVFAMPKGSCVILQVAWDLLGQNKAGVLA